MERSAEKWTIYLFVWFVHLVYYYKVRFHQPFFNAHLLQQQYRRIKLQQWGAIILMCKILSLSVKSGSIVADMYFNPNGLSPGQLNCNPKNGLASVISFFAAKLADITYDGTRFFFTSFFQKKNV